MSNTSTTYQEVRDAFIFHVRTLVWRFPEARIWIAYRKVPGKRTILATVDVEAHREIMDGDRPGWVLPVSEPIPVSMDDVQRARWIDAILRALPLGLEEA